MICSTTTASQSKPSAWDWITRTLTRGLPAGQSEVPHHKKNTPKQPEELESFRKFEFKQGNVCGSERKHKNTQTHVRQSIKRTRHRDTQPRRSPSGLKIPQIEIWLSYLWLAWKVHPKKEFGLGGHGINEHPDERQQPVIFSLTLGCGHIVVFDNNVVFYFLSMKASWLRLSENYTTDI